MAEIPFFLAKLIGETILTYPLRTDNLFANILYTLKNDNQPPQTMQHLQVTLSINTFC